MPAPAATGDARRGQVRLATFVIVVTMPLWMALSWAGGALGWPVRYAFLIDFAALGALAFSLIVLFRVWHLTRSTGT
jgi:Family of unknown function (DUF5337)